MFKFMKSKKGFTLVELMIVVVIMAILVAVAVPIFSAVTANAKKKTCIGNQREIISSVGNWLMLQPTSDIAGTFETSGGQEEPEIVIATDGDLKDYKTEIENLFKTAPVCPDAANKIVVTIAADQTGAGKSTVSTECVVAADIQGGAAAGTATDHVVPGA